MKNLIKEAPTVAQAFFDLTAAIRGNSCLGAKQNELVLVGIFTASHATKGIATHVERAMTAGATKEEIISAITLALPVAGIPAVNLALAKALDVMESISQGLASHGNN